MEDVTRYRAFEAFCRQHAKMEGESELFWLNEAELLARLAETNRRLEQLAKNRGAEAA